ncbi:biotin--protein ligase isoform X1 [Drosophila sulfurigaster albostrigata]|uniref:biotin--protein ligase isoform X1 n=1 Tax=Drosophila sulfurigaster albostrigata TaxID=89887 RepID=UPI002D21E971|nr:biotin--protein ligase isoform X1 [Drosophila sulfurigaster albostrigata]
MLTLYYVSATLVQSWRIQRACNKIAEQLAQSSSIAFYTLQTGNDDGFDPTFASSELCGNRNAAKVTDILWLHGNQRGCCLRPLQAVQITPWISFPNAPSLLPFAHASDTATPTTTPTDAQQQQQPLPRITLSPDKSQHLHLLVESQIEVQRDAGSLQTTNTKAVRLEDYGKLIAWKIDSHLAVLIETDVEHFTKLLIMTFLQNNLCINDNLPLMRIESVQREGQPQPIELLTNHVKRQSRTSIDMNAESWQKHLKDLRALSVLAHQATEFELQKNRTEGKTGLPKQELTPQRQVEPPLVSGTTPVKAVAVVEPTTKATSPAKALTTPLKQPSPVQSPLNKPSELEKIAASKVTQRQQPIDVQDSPKAAVEIRSSTPPSKTSTPSKSFVAVKPNSPPTTPTSGVAATASRTRPVLRRNKDSLGESKPLNVLVYSDSASARESAIATLRQLLERDVYTIYALTPHQAAQKYWIEQTALLVVCGSVAPGIGQVLVDYFLQGGRVLSICSDILHFILPNYRTAEVREHELVQFSYDKWQRVKMMHHIFCYQPSPVKKNFSTDSEESAGPSHSRKPALVCPRSMELKDLSGQTHKLDVKVLGTEETWNTPSLMLANSLHSGGKAVFSQVHLETNPSEFEFDEVKFAILKQNESTRLEIFTDLLRKYLGVQVRGAESADPTAAGVIFKQAYFLGRHESKFELLEKLRPRCSGTENVIVTPKLTMKFCGKDDTAPAANTNVLPILIHSCPDDFSTVDYFDNLKTEHIGRLVIYAPVVSSSMYVINDLELVHGIAVLPLQQTAGVGRSNNQWLSPLGCAMFSTQLHIATDSPLGSRLPLIQHIIGAAIVNTLRSHPQYKVLDIALKWPNDIIANGNNKIGGLVVNTTLLGSLAIVNIGCGINLNNSKPTVCINDMIRDYNVRMPEVKLPLLKYEQFIALVFNEIERLLADVQNGNFKSFYELYYELWLHSEQSIKICLQNDQEKEATVVGIDDYGFLKVRLANGAIETVQPDGNSFDMMQGLIVPKFT